jgi:hypothetical protein
VDQRIHAALARAAAAAADAKDDDDEKASHVFDPAPDASNLQMHEVAALLHLHSQAITVHNIRLPVPIVLDLAANIRLRLLA